MPRPGRLWADLRHFSDLRYAVLGLGQLAGLGGMELTASNPLLRANEWARTVRLVLAKPESIRHQLIASALQLVPLKCAILHICQLEP